MHMALQGTLKSANLTWVVFWLCVWCSLPKSEKWRDQENALFSAQNSLPASLYILINTTTQLEKATFSFNPWYTSAALNLAYSKSKRKQSHKSIEACRKATFQTGRKLQQKITYNLRKYLVLSTVAFFNGMESFWCLWLPYHRFIRNKTIELLKYTA